jgi:hypothetical protein
VISIYNERLQNELTRDSALKAISKISANSSSKNSQIIKIGNLATLIPRMFELLHKAQRTIHLNTLETMVSMVSRYPQQF